MVQKGQCLCGAIKLTIHEDQDKQIACHCELGGNGGIRFEADLSL